MSHYQNTYDAAALKYLDSQQKVIKDAEHHSRVTGVPVTELLYGHQAKRHSINGHQPMTDREMLCFANGSLRAIENMSLDRMRDEVTRLRSDIKKHLGVE